MNINILSLFTDLIIRFLFCVTLIKTLSQIHPQNRVVSSSLLWLFIVPFLNIFLSFYIVIRMAQSIKNEWLFRGYEVEEEPGLKTGMIMSVMFVMVNIAGLFFDRSNPMKSPILALALALSGLLWLISFIQYWMKMNWYRKVFESEK